MLDILRLMKNSATFPLHGIFLRSKFNPFFFNISVDFPEKESATKFSGVLILFHEISTFQSFEFDVSDVIPTKVHNISSLLFIAYFC